MNLQKKLISIGWQILPKKIKLELAMLMLYLQIIKVLLQMSGIISLGLLQVKQLIEQAL